VRGDRDACRAAIEWTLEVTRFAVAEITGRPCLEALPETDLSVVVFGDTAGIQRTTRPAVLR
jgi:hypothetical protein